MRSLSQWKTRMQTLSQHLLRTDQRVKELTKRVRAFREQADVTTNLQKLRDEIKKGKND